LAYLHPALLVAGGAGLGFPLARLLAPWAGWAVFAASALLALPRILELNSEECLLTDMRLTVRRGWLRRWTMETALDKVGAIAVDESLLGRLLGYGDLRLMVAGGAAETLVRVRAPRSLQRKAMQRILALKYAAAETFRQKL